LTPDFVSDIIREFIIRAEDTNPLTRVEGDIVSNAFDDLEAGPPTGPGGRPPGLFVTHAQWAGGRPFRIFQWAGWAGVV